MHNVETFIHSFFQVHELAMSLWPGIFSPCLIRILREYFFIFNEREQVFIGKQKDDRDGAACRPYILYDLFEGARGNFI